VTNVSNVLPIIDNGPLGEKDTIFLVWAQMYHSLPALQAYYPEGTRETVRLGDAAHPAQPLIAYIITHQQIDRHRMLHVRYAPRGGQAVERTSPAIGLAGDAVPPTGLRYPVRATWNGGLVAPADDTYRFQLNAPVGTRLTIDGRDVFPARTPAGRPATAVVALTQGPHTVHLAATLTDRRTRVVLQWAQGAGPLAPIARRYLWDNHVTRS
jgi:hypothetical protein